MEKIDDAIFMALNSLFSLPDFKVDTMVANVAKYSENLSQKINRMELIETLINAKDLFFYDYDVASFSLRIHNNISLSKIEEMIKKQLIFTKWTCIDYHALTSYLRFYPELIIGDKLISLHYLFHIIDNCLPQFKLIKLTKIWDENFIYMVGLCDEKENDLREIIKQELEINKVKNKKEAISCMAMMIDVKVFALEIESVLIEMGINCD